ncbi:hydantoinase/oxoprolinase family protein [Chloroflexota bacterium]
MGYKIGVDVGGTFTDFLIVDDKGKFWIYKTPSTPEDPSIGLMNGLEGISAEQNMTTKDLLSQTDIIVHGTTITVNAILTDKTAKVGFITTKGFRDYLTQRRGIKRQTFNPKESPPPPAVPRYLRQVVEERIDCEGKVLIPLKEEEIYSAIEIFKRENVEAVAVNFIFSFLNTSHEKRVKEIIEKEMPGTYVCISSEVLPQVRIYERASTTVFNACVGPVLRTYIDNLLGRLAQIDFKGILLIMQSNGGVMSPEIAMDFAVNTLLSGPAGGPVASKFYGNIHGIQNIIAVDMGGTSFDASLIKKRELEVTTENDVAEYRVATPSLLIHTIGAGGGSIAWVDPGGILRVGPASAGAVPGPACYDMGGEEPTVTDANLVLGYLNQDNFLGCRMKLHVDKAEKAMQKVADPLGLNLKRAAYGVYKLVNSNMSQGVRLISISRGYDPREFTLIIAGGAGPAHACEIAKELEMPLILIPKQSSVFCAFGMLATNLRHDLVRACYMLMKEEFVDLGKINALYKEMKEEALSLLQKEGTPQGKMTFSYTCDLRYESQFNEIEVPVPLSSDGIFTMNELALLWEGFHQKHDALYGYSLPGFPIESVSLRVSAEGITEKVALTEAPFMGEDASKAQKGYREIYFEGQLLRTPIYDGTKMSYGNMLVGPAIIEEPTTTLFVTPDYNMLLDRYSNYLMYPKGKILEDILAKMKKE